MAQGIGYDKYHCQSCEAVFSSLGTLATHVRLQHQAFVAEKPYQSNEIDKTLAERDKTYGNFQQNAFTIQALKKAMQGSIGWDHLEDDEKESLELIATKIGRILSGMIQKPDNWHDISGYAKLVEDRLNEQNLGKEKK